MTADGLLNAYLDLNFLLLVGAAMWLALRWLLSRLDLGHDFIRQQRLLNGMVIVLVAAPALAGFVHGQVTAGIPNLTDLLVAQYLSGNVGMSATAFEGMLGAREAFERDVLSGQSQISRLLWVLLGLGALWAVSGTAVAILRLRRILRRSYPLRRIGRLRILISDTTRVAFSTRGLRNRYVVLPSGMLQSGQDMRMVVAHELQHLRHRDVEIEFMFELMRPLLFWNPAFYLWRREMRALREYACDQALVARHSFDARAYCECLIRACEAAARRPRTLQVQLPAVGLVDLRNIRRGATLKHRIVAATGSRPSSGSSTGWLALSLVMVALVLGTAMMIQRPADWSHDRIMLSTIVNLERMAARNSGPARDGAPAGFVFTTY